MTRSPFVYSLFILWVLVSFTGCSGLEEEDSPFGDTFGSGSAGEAVGSNLTTESLVSSSGVTLGTVQYDSDYFVDVGDTLDTAGTRMLYLFNCTPSVDDDLNVTACTASHSNAQLELEFFQISGLPATPCRFQAALLARDEGYDVGDFGDVKNDQGLEFHQVNVSKSGSAVQFYCTELRSEVGVMVRAESSDKALLDGFQLRAVLNSINS